MNALKNEINKSLSNGFWGSVVLPKLHAGGQYPDCFEQNEADGSAPT